MRNLNGRLNHIEDLVRKRKGANAWRTAVQFDDGPIYLLPTPDQFNYRDYIREEDCIRDGLPVITEAETDENTIILNYRTDLRSL